MSQHPKHNDINSSGNDTTDAQNPNPADTMNTEMQTASNINTDSVNTDNVDVDTDASSQTEE